MNAKQRTVSSATVAMMVVLATVVTVVVAAAVLVVLLPCASASENGSESLQEHEEWVSDPSYGHTVADDWIVDLPPEEQDALCGYKPLEIPEDPNQGNSAFISKISCVKTNAPTDPPVGSLPPAYDARDLEYVTSIKNQLSCGSCWIFAAVADVESGVAIREPGSLPDYSEQEIGDCNIWSGVGGYDFCSGGNAFMTTNYLTKYGVTDEADHPYVEAAGTCRDSPILKNVNGWRRITGKDGDLQTHRDTIKQAILDYGPIYSTINSSDPAFYSYKDGVYERNTTGYTNHAVQIVGWDDTMPHSHDDATGAWLIKNSWGVGWGISGYAWVAYGSADIGDYTNAITGYGDSSDTIFYHDECGWMGHSYGSSAAYGAVRFTPSENITLVAVDFWAVDSGMSYEIRVFDTLNDLGSGDYNFSAQIGGAETGTTNESGYYSIPLETSVPLTEGDDFIVQVRLEGAGGRPPIPIDYTTESWLPDWSKIAEFSNESYYSGDGAVFSFTKPVPYDVGIRARARHCYNTPNISTNDGIENTTGGDCANCCDCVGTGDFINYTICYDNLPNPVESLTNVTITDILPLNVTFVSASAGGVYDPDAHSVTWEIGDLAGGRCGGEACGACATLNVTVNQDACGTTLTNCAVITSDETEPATACGNVGVREPPEPVPVTTPVGAMLLIGFMALAGCVVMKRGA